jgi:DNA-binding beta-propeller fold protein YncE
MNRNRYFHLLACSVGLASSLGCRASGSEEPARAEQTGPSTSAVEAVDKNEPLAKAELGLSSNKKGPKHPHEVWLVDQSNTAGLTHGGTLYIYASAQLQSDAATAVPEVIDLGGATSALCLAETGVAPVRPHMLVFNEPDATHAILAFVASGHVVFFDAGTRAPLRCFRTEVGAGGARQAHAVSSTPDGHYALVANQNGKKLERIATDYKNNLFAQDPLATLDLAGCTTPNGLPCQHVSLRPDTAPICPFVPSTGFPAYISLRGGGMFAVNPNSTPMSIVAEYESPIIPRDGCGFVEAKGWVYGNGGGGNALNPDGWFIYRVPQGDANVYKASNGPNTPAPEVIDHDTSDPRDAHGVAKTKDESYVWFFDRAANVAEIFHAKTGDFVATVDLVDPQLSTDPTPDLVSEAPDGQFFYASLRGPNPLTGDPHASTGTTPGLLVIEVLNHGQLGAVRGIARINNIDAGGVQRADAHGIRARRLNADD